MHEMSLAQSLLDLAVQHAQGHPIVALKIRVGALSGVVADSLEFCFEFVSKGTLAEGAKVEFDNAPVRLQCRSCGQTVSTEKWQNTPGHEVVYLATEEGCPACGGKDLKVVGGLDFQLVEIEVREEAAEGQDVGDVDRN